MIIKRDEYIQLLSSKRGNGLIKVITGLRRAGKSYLLFKLFKDELIRNGIDDKHIIEIDLESRLNKELRDPDAIIKYIKGITDKSKKKYFLFIDEVQKLSDFEDVLNTFLHFDNLDVYVTGSNSKFLSKDIITEFRGRGDEIHVFPLSFKEYMSAYDGDVYQGWADYYTYGGLPYVMSLKTDKEKIAYLENLFAETYLIDIIERNGVEKTQEFEDLLNVLASSISSLTNPLKIQKTFKSELNSNISDNTIRQYIEYMEEAFLISKAQRYDVKGRKYIGTPLKYYFEDVGLRNARIGFRQTEENHIMENVIYNELRLRGFNVDVGMVKSRAMKNGVQENKQLEVDFVANQGSKRVYVQSAFQMSIDEKREQEKASFKNIHDSFKKIFIVRDVVNVQRDNDGYVTMSIFDFLLDKNSLDL